MTEIHGGAWLDRQHFPAVTWIVPGIIPEGQTLLVAPPKAGKSWLVYAIAIARATGGIVLGQRVQSGPVLYLALEDGWRRLQERGRALLDPGERIPDGIDYVIALEPGTVIDTVGRWIGEHGGRNPLVIIDTFGKVKPPARNGTGAYEHDYAVMGALKRLVDTEPGSGMILVHHDRKASSDDFLDSVSGTNGIAGAADTTVVIGRARTQGEAVLSVTGRDVTEAEYAAVFERGAWRLDGADLRAARDQVAVNRATKNLGDQSAEIVQLIYQHPDGLSPKQINAELSIGNNVGVYLKRLVDAGRIESPRRGLYTPVRTVRTVRTVDESDVKLADLTGITPAAPTVAGAGDSPPILECRLCTQPTRQGSDWCDADDADHRHARELVEVAS